MSCTRPRALVWRAVVLAAAAALTIAVGCGGDSDDDERSDRSSVTADETSTTQSPTTATTPEAEAEAAYLEFVETVNRLLTISPNPDDLDLARLAVDPVLGKVRDSLTTLQAENHIWQTGARTSHHVMSVESGESDTMVLKDCYVGNDTRIDRDDGTVVSSGLSTELFDVTLQLRERHWVVGVVTTAQVFDGEVECPA